jgi:hypothetical protein
MAARKTAALEEYIVNIGGIDHTVQLTAEDAEVQNARKGRADADKNPTAPVQIQGGTDAFKGAEAPANKAATAPADK